MTDQTKRSLLKFGGFTDVALASVLASCGKKEEAGPTGSSARFGCGASLGGCAPAAPGRCGSRSRTWVRSVRRWLDVAELTTGARRSKSTSKDKDQHQLRRETPGGRRRRARVSRHGEPGHQLIFGTTFGYMEPMLKVAADSRT
jgi:simple sugar transport system substrate-binding protein